MQSIDNKYYQPDISELYLGYETFWIRDMVAELTDDNLVHFTFDIKKLSALLNPFRPFNPKGEMKWTPDLTMSYRTKVLDSDDIISLGFTKVSLGQYRKYDTYITMHSDGEIEISQDYINCFFGKCKSINELKKILEWIK